jgi:ankyrin repeat protein
MILTPEQKKALNDVLQRGVDSADEDMMRLSLEKGADPDLMVTGMCNKGSLGKASAPLLTLALAKGADPNLMLFAAIQREALGAVKIAVEQGGADVNCTHTAPGKTDAYTTGEWSYRAFNSQISDYLLSRGMNVDLQSQDGQTPLLRAVCDENYSKTIHYISHGANPLIADGRGRFPLQVLQSGSYGYNSTFAEKRNDMLKAMLKNVPDDVQAGPAAPADAFNAVATGEDIEVNRPLELKKAAVTPPEDRPRKGFQL